MKYEYDVQGPYEDKRLQKRLDHMAGYGWELVAVTRSEVAVTVGENLGYTLFFKRPKVEDA